MKYFLCAFFSLCLVLLASAEEMAVAVSVQVPANNHWLNKSPYPISHHNPAQTDLSIISSPTIGKKLVIDDVKSVPVFWCSAPIIKTHQGKTTIIAGTPHGLFKINGTGEAFDLVSYMSYPQAGAQGKAFVASKIEDYIASIDYRRRNKQDWRLLMQSWYTTWDAGLNHYNGASGVYGLIDKDGYYYAGYNRTHILKAFDDNEITAPLRVVKSVNIVESLPSAVAESIERLMGITLTYDGHLVVAASGALFVLDRELNVKDYLLFPEEHVENSIAADEKGIYIVTSKNMRKVVWSGEKLSMDEQDGAWISPYNTMLEGEAHKMGAASHGSGTTPTLMGFGEDEDKLVIIADANVVGTQLVAFWRENIPQGFKQKPGTLSRRIADQILISISTTTIEASPVVYENGVLILNSTYPEASPLPSDLLGNGFTSGITREPPKGALKYDWNVLENRFEESWLLPDVDNTDWMVPAISAQSGLVFLANKQNATYEYIAVDWKTGEQKSRWEFPDDSSRWNTWGGITTLLEDGDLLTGGFFAVKRFNIGHLR